MFIKSKNKYMNLDIKLSDQAESGKMSSDQFCGMEN